MFYVLLYVLYVPSSFAIILMGKRELVALLSLSSSSCLVIVMWLSSWYHCFVCSLWVWYFLIMLTSLLSKVKDGSSLSLQSTPITTYFNSLGSAQSVWHMSQNQPSLFLLDQIPNHYFYDNYFCYFIWKEIFTQWRIHLASNEIKCKLPPKWVINSDNWWLLFLTLKNYWPVLISDWAWIALNNHHALILIRFLHPSVKHGWLVPMSQEGNLPVSSQMGGFFLGFF